MKKFYSAHRCNGRMDKKVDEIISKIPSMVNVIKSSEIIQKINQKLASHTVCQYTWSVVDAVWKIIVKTQHEKEAIDLIYSLSSESWETKNHVKRVAYLSNLLTRLLRDHEKFQSEIDAWYIEEITIWAPGHDLWKAFISKSILEKPWKLNQEEWEVMKSHSIYWWMVIHFLEQHFGNTSLLQICKNISLLHHEKYDGSWYPLWLKWDKIPLEARIVGVVDVLDALKSKRCYKTDFSDEKSKEIMIQWSWTHFDPDIIDIVLKNWEYLLYSRTEFMKYEDIERYYGEKS